VLKNAQDYCLLHLQRRKDQTNESNSPVAKGRFVEKNFARTAILTQNMSPNPIPTPKPNPSSKTKKEGLDCGDAAQHRKKPRDEMTDPRIETVL
jgi:hypothetical protein